MDNQQHEILNDEVDLLSTLKRVLNALQTRIKWLILFLIVSVIVAMTLSFTVVLPIYKGVMVIKPRFLTTGELSSIAFPLTASIKSGRDTLVSKALSITLKEAESLSDISVKSQVDSVTVLVSVDAESKAIFNDKMQQNLVDFFQNSKYASKLKGLTLERKKARLATLEMEINRLDTLKKRLETGKLSGMLMSGSDLYNTSINLANERTTIKQYLDEKEDIDIVSSFAYTEKASDFKHSTMLLAGIALGIVAWLLLVVILEIKIMLAKLKDK